jgi:hypothetical protein
VRQYHDVQKGLSFRLCGYLRSGDRRTFGGAERIGCRTRSIIHDKFTADPAPLVVGDTLYLYTGHDGAVVIHEVRHAARKPSSLPEQG